MLCSSLRLRIRSCFRDYDHLQFYAIILIYIQIGCALIGSLGAKFNGVLLVHLIISLFALIAIESSSQSLGRTYAVLLFCAILLDIFWFILYSTHIWNITSEKYEPLVMFSLRLTLLMQIIGLFMRTMSSVIWIQIYRLGVSSVDNTSSREADFDLRNSFLNPPTPAVDRQTSNGDDMLGGSIYDPVYYSSLFENVEENGPAYRGNSLGTEGSSGSTSLSESPQLKLGRSFQVCNMSYAP
ncbi:hypothetical protein ACHQM5_018629 [Ranunculus cassubicifolius]